MFTTSKPMSPRKGDHGRGSRLASWGPLWEKPDRGPTSTHTHTLLLARLITGVLRFGFQPALRATHYSKLSHSPCNIMSQLLQPPGGELTAPKSLTSQHPTFNIMCPKSPMSDVLAFPSRLQPTGVHVRVEGVMRL